MNMCASAGVDVSLYAKTGFMTQSYYSIGLNPLFSAQLGISSTVLLLLLNEKMTLEILSKEPALI